MLTLHDWQQADVDEASKHDSAFFAWEMGLGKTLASVEYAKAKGAETIIVVLPLNTRKSWERTILGQIPDANVYRIDGVTKNLKNDAYLKEGRPGWYLIGWELMRTGAISGRYADLIIADETHKQANFGVSDQAIVLRQINSKYKLALSGTPAANRREGIFSTLNWLWPQQYRSLNKWIDNYWRVRRNGAVIDLVREIEPGKIIADIPMFSRRLVKDHRTDMPDVLPEIVVEVELSPAQRKIYTQFYKLALAWLGDHPVATALPLTQDIRLRQVALGVPTVNSDGEIEFSPTAKSSKIEALLDIMDTEELREDTFLVLVHSARFIPTVIAQLAKKGIKAEGFHGEVKPAERERLLEEFGTTYRVLVAGIAAIGEGTDGLQYKCHNMVWLSKHGNAMLNTQAKWRLDRPGQTHPINVWNIVARDTVDERSEERLAEIDENLDSMIDNPR